MTKTCPSSRRLCIIWLKLLPAVIIANFLIHSPNKHNIKPQTVINHNCFNWGQKWASIVNSVTDAMAAIPYSLLWFNRNESNDNDFGFIIEVIKYSLKWKSDKTDKYNPKVNDHWFVPNIDNNRPKERPSPNSAALNET